MDPTIATIILAVSFVLMLLLRFPIALTIAGSTLLTVMYLDIPWIVVGQRMVQGMNSYSLLAIPFFILAGTIMGEGGLATRLIQFAQLFVGAVRGGLAMVNCIACLFFGNISGSAAADVSSIGSVLIPAMKKKGYDADYTVAVTTSAAIQGVVVPPSHNMLIYSLAAGGVSVSALFLAGIVPGLLLLATLMTVSYIIAVKRGYSKGEPIPLKEVPRIVKEGFLSLMTGVIILGGIFSGWFTATEAGAIACVYAYILTFFVYKDLPMSHTWVIFKKTFRTVAMVLFLISASDALGWVLAYLKIPAMVTDLFLSVTDNPLLILLMINILLLLLGAPMDMAPMLLIMTPILLPVVTQLGMDPVHFGIIMVLNCGIGLITPPVGTVLFIGCAIGKVTVEQATKASWPFFLAMVGVLFLITYVPGLVMWLPDLILNK
ncbi:TRAP transporter large permease [Paenibacillus sp. GD4]|jgi:tripartite ATP-independent transporter DctM subunit|uniref:TRAP transporter large permease n=1 Tax=Paenibacillus sp. GD4 TaxID=3068890 RepID=UPI0027969497|nr:TRAP transporter large permease [Paenibacillus sp. GD4]MDQ1912761.1 TRAP transporter large permease [Paenibacillus sp. GD4]